MKKRIQVILAHPDDGAGCGGTAIKLARAGHVVQLLSLTNGQSGHHEIPGQKLVIARYNETQESKKRLGIDSYVVLDNNDGYLFADVPTRERLMKAIREFKPDIIITHRPYEHHPDVRNASLLVHDCAYMIRVPNFLPLSPVPDVLPVVFYKQDSIMKPVPFNPDIVVDIDDVADMKLRAYDAHTTQMYEWKYFIEQLPQQAPSDPKARLEWLGNILYPEWANIADRFRDKLIEKYGEKRGRIIKYAEAYEAAECGFAHNLEAEKALFSFN